MELNKKGFLAAVMALGISACGGDAETETADNDMDTAGDEVVVEEQVYVEPEPEPMDDGMNDIDEPDLGPTPE